MTDEPLNPHDPRDEPAIMLSCFNLLREMDPTSGRRTLAWLRACLKQEWEGRGSDSGGEGTP